MAQALGNSARRKFRGNLLRTLRNARGESQLSVAELVNTDRSNVSRWEKGLGNVDPKTVKKLGEHYEVDPEFFYDSEEQRIINSVVVFGSHAIFTECSASVVNAARRILVFQTGGPKAPTWWREQLGQHVSNTVPHVSYIVVACIPPASVTGELFLKIDTAISEFGEDVVDLHILEENPQLALDLMVVDGRHLFLALQTSEQGPRHCCIHIENEGIAGTLEEWLFRLLRRAKPYSEWRQHYKSFA